MHASVLCKECGVSFSFYVHVARDGFRRVTCPWCSVEQFAYVKFKVITVPVVIGTGEKG